MAISNNGADMDLLLPSDAVILTQGRTGEEPFMVGAVSTAEIFTTVVIKSLPTFGTLLTTTDMSGESLPIVKGDNLTVPEGDAGVNISYEAINPFYFSVPRSQSLTAFYFTSDSFIYLTESRHVATGELVKSRTVTKRIDVRNVNHAPVLNVPYQAFNLTAPEYIQDSPFAIINGIAVHDVDNNVNKVRVDVSATNGTLSINNEFRSLADFDCRSSQGWQCQGRGVQDQSMTFLADPSHVEYILHDLRYTSFDISNSDVISLRILDGIGPDCLGDDEQAFGVSVDGNLYSSIQPSTCFRVYGEMYVAGQTSIPVQEGCFWELHCWDWRFVGIVVGYNVAGFVGFCVLGCYIVKLLEWCCGRVSGSNVMHENKDNETVEVPIIGNTLVVGDMEDGGFLESHDIYLHDDGDIGDAASEGAVETDGDTKSCENLVGDEGIYRDIIDSGKDDDDSMERDEGAI